MKIERMNQRNRRGRRHLAFREKLECTTDLTFAVPISRWRNNSGFRVNKSRTEFEYAWRHGVEQECRPNLRMPPRGERVWTPSEDLFSPNQQMLRLCSLEMAMYSGRGPSSSCGPSCSREAYEDDKRTETRALIKPGLQLPQRVGVNGVGMGDVAHQRQSASFCGHRTLCDVIKLRAIQYVRIAEKMVRMGKKMMFSSPAPETSYRNSNSAFE